MAQISLALVGEDLVRAGWRSVLDNSADFLCLGEVSAARGALALIQRTRPDVALIDLELADGNGVALTAEIKARLGSVRVLILTLDRRPQSVFGAFGAGADSYCLADTRPELVREAIKATHQGNTWIDPAVARVLVAALPGAVAAKSQMDYSLTEREEEILQLIVDGLSNAAIAQKLYITVGTVKTHVRNILHKLGAEDRAQAAVRALRSGLAQ